MNLKKITKKIRNKFKNLISSKLGAKVVCYILHSYVKMIGNTTTWEFKGTNHIKDLWKDNKNFIFVGWHGRSLMMPWLWYSQQQYNVNNNKIKALVSLHKDGRIIAGLIESFGLGTIGGSTTFNAKEAALKLMRTLNDNNSVTIIPDGPCGPNMIMNPSPIYYAHKTGRPIVPITYSVKSSIIVNSSWDQMMIPLLFSKGTCTIHEPIYVPQDATTEQLEEYKIKLEKLLQDMTIQSDIDLGRKPVTVGTAKLKKSRKIKK